MTEKERMLSGKLYIAQGEELMKDRQKCKRILHLYNQTTEEEKEYRGQLLENLFERIGKNFQIEPPFHCDYGCHISIGDYFYSNYDCIIIDVCDVKIGNHVFFGPRVGLYTAGHPIDPEVRNTMLEFGKPITIGDNVWIGGNVVVTPGVTIGNNVVIGAGSVVTRDIPDNCVAVGNPCRVLRPITEQDKSYWKSLEEEYRNSL